MPVRVKRSFGRKLAIVAGFVLISPLLIPLIILALAAYFLNLATLYVLVWVCWLPQGKDVLYVSSNSPIWREYMQQEILPLVARRAVVLNWSDRRNWRKLSLRRRVFRAFRGERNYNPLVILFRPLRRARVFRFWPAFKEWKHGHPEGLEQLRRDLTSAL